MKTIIKEIKKGQMMIDIIPILITNCIYNKTIPGIGATTMEIDARRNSIIVLPFIPVIQGKQYDKDGQLRKDILGVFDNVTKEQITVYIEKRGNKIKKILCTPEKFPMVMEAIKHQGDNPYTSYFLLLDECETMIKDVDYRPKIKLPMKDFFEFKAKAMISATPIMPRDSRFERQQFTYVKIQPVKSWKTYRKKLDLMCTNNVVSVLRKYINDHPEETLCIFTNCSKTITKTIADLGLENDARVFSSKKLNIKRFRVTKIKHSYSSIKQCEGKLGKVNFFTSRFFSAVDMVFPKIKPHIIMVTNIYHANHSKIDPVTDAIQISGRFRKGIKKMIHISNFNPDVPLMTLKEIKKETDDLLIVYKHINELRVRSRTNKYINKWIDEIFAEPPFIKRMNEGKLDTYLVDNIQHRDYVSSYYINSLRLKEAYEATNYFDVNYSYESLKITDEDIMRRDAVAGAERRKVIAYQLHKYYTENAPFDLDLTHYEELHEFRMMDEVVYTAYFDLGLQFMEDVKYQLKALRTGILNKNKEKLKTSEVITAAVDIEFHRNETVTNNEAKDRLQSIYDLYADHSITAVGTDIKLYYKTTELHSIKRENSFFRGYRLGEPLFVKNKALTDRNVHLNLL